MMGGSQRVSYAALFALGLAFGATGVSAQAVEYPEEPSIAEAERLEYQAEGRLAHMDQWKEAAKELRTAASLRPEGDPKAIEDLILAGKLSFYRGGAISALRDLRLAGERALQEGFVQLAARAFVDAAWVANEDGRASEAQEFGKRAQLLSHSPMIDDQLKEEIRARLSSGA